MKTVIPKEKILLLLFFGMITKRKDGVRSSKLQHVIGSSKLQKI
jgi:hypothetical protein